MNRIKISKAVIFVGLGLLAAVSYLNAHTAQIVRHTSSVKISGNASSIRMAMPSSGDWNSPLDAEAR